MATLMNGMHMVPLLDMSRLLSALKCGPSLVPLRNLRGLSRLPVTMKLQSR